MVSWTKIWDKERAKLKKIYDDHWITECEVQLPGCTKNNFLGFHHRHKRNWYKERGRRELLGEFNQTILVCNNCHDKIEDDRAKTKEIFQQLRGIDE